MEKTSISSPWITYYHQIDAMFRDDPDIRISFDDSANVIKMYVRGQRKADALAELLPEEKFFGGVKVTTCVIPDNAVKDKASLISTALDGNPNFAYLKRIQPLPVASNTYNYLVFAKKVCQYWNDNLGDPHGNVSCLYQDLAKEIFGEGGGVMYCTDSEEPEQNATVG